MTANKKEYMKKYRQSEKYKKWRREYQKSEKGKIVINKYRQSKKGKETTKKRNEKRYEESKNILKELKINGCAICGYDKCNMCLHFHHIVGINNPNRIVSQYIRKASNSEITDELQKCVLLCANCHYETHFNEKVVNCEQSRKKHIQ
jgi:hypothetical protein